MKRVSAVFVMVMMAGGGMFAQDAKKGEAAFAELKCGTCHSVAGKGGKLASALDGIATKRTKEVINSWMTDSAAMEKKLEKAPKMPMSKSAAMKNIKPEQVKDIEAYLATLK